MSVRMYIHGHPPPSAPGINYALSPPLPLALEVGPLPVPSPLAHPSFLPLEVGPFKPS